jgi:hypothetical protein
MGQSMNATLNVIDGSPVGTPGVATVTVQGAGETGTFSPCPPNPHATCVETMSETGTISITIAGITFSTTYGGYPSTANLAAALAMQMNGPLSPISATVSGSTINISSTVSGADTNYPLSTSFTFNQECNLTYGSSACLFYSPAFTAVASGSQLTGGTN